MNKIQKIKLLSELYGWKYLFLKTEDKLLGGDRAVAYGDERMAKAKPNEYPKILKGLYKLNTGENLDLDDPKSFNEKIQWLKIYDSTPMKTRLADKYLVRDWVAEKIGEEYLIPLLGVWDSFDEIDFDALPDQFVLKCNHGSGMNEVVKDKASIDKAAMKQKFDKWMATDYSIWGMELQYRDIPRKIIAEKYLEDKATSELRDYKFFCFNGEVKALYIAEDRQVEGEETKFDFFDAEYNHLNIKNGHPNAKAIPNRPLNFALMKELASRLSADILHVRIDFYECNEKVYFGEMTFSHMSGFAPFDPPEWDTVFGSWLELPNSVK